VDDDCYGIPFINADAMAFRVRNTVTDYTLMPIYVYLPLEVNSSVVALMSHM